MSTIDLVYFHVFHPFLNSMYDTKIAAMLGETIRKDEFLINVDVYQKFILTIIRHN